jgi:hypothetical protein
VPCKQPSALCRLLVPWGRASQQLGCERDPPCDAPPLLADPGKPGPASVKPHARRRPSPSCTLHSNAHDPSGAGGRGWRQALHYDNVRLAPAPRVLQRASPAMQVERLGHASIRDGRYYCPCTPWPVPRREHAGRASLHAHFN